MTPPASPDLSNYTINSLFSFKATGLDFAGLLYVRTSEEDAVLKVYILLLTCANSWGIHLELTPGMEVPSFIRGFKRFMLRIGIPDVVVSDNFKSFQSNEFTLQHQIIQKFILPASSWWGNWGGGVGWCGEGVAMPLKKALQKALFFLMKSKKLYFIRLNSRPLVYVSEEGLNESLTPYHLIYGRNIFQKRLQNIPKDLKSLPCRVKY